MVKTMTSPADLLPLLRKVRSLRFEARSEAATGWDGVGVGTVAVSNPEANTVVFGEAGEFRPAAPDRPAVRFTNVFRWSAVGNSLRLEHLRFGPDHPVLLFDLTPTADGTWKESSPHQCREDCYAASLAVEGTTLVVAWSIHGPRKRESIRYAYS